MRPACLFAILTALAMPSSSAAAPRMWVGFEDNANFEWNADRAEMLRAAHDAHATIIRIAVDWWRIAPVRPRVPASYDDPAYRFHSLDDITRHAQALGLQVMFAIWGTPAWANGGAAPNRPPANVDDLTSFARALASRYSGLHAGLPFVGFYTVWNESNMGRFLSPQYDGAGRPVSPRLYAMLYRAAWKGIKEGNNEAKVGIGETSSHGALGPPRVRGVQASLAPARFAQLLAKANPRLPFDAWSLHPYPTSRSQPPTHKGGWPNVTMMQLDHFERSLRAWFGRGSIPLWITEYGYETAPAEPKGVTEAAQASYLRQAFAIARGNPNVTMFVWFMLRDDPTSAWQSGLIARNGRRKPALATFSAVAAPTDMRNPVVSFRGGTSHPPLLLPVPELLTNSPPGVDIRAAVNVFERNQIISSTQSDVNIYNDGYVKLFIPIVVKAEHRYTVEVTMHNLITGNQAARTATIVGR